MNLTKRIERMRSQATRFLECSPESHKENWKHTWNFAAPHRPKQNLTKRIERIIPATHKVSRRRRNLTKRIESSGLRKINGNKHYPESHKENWKSMICQCGTLIPLSEESHKENWKERGVKYAYAWQSYRESHKENWKYFSHTTS